MSVACLIGCMHAHLHHLPFEYSSEISPTLPLLDLCTLLCVPVCVCVCVCMSFRKVPKGGREAV